MASILIADDNRQISSILDEYACKEGYQTLLSYDGREALSLFSSRVPDVVLLDVMIPKMDGFGVCREIQNHLRLLRFANAHPEVFTQP